MGRSALMALAVLLAVLSTRAWAVEPHASFQQYEIKFDGSTGIDLEHYLAITDADGWSGCVKMNYPFGVDQIFESPEEILEWESRVMISVDGCEHEIDYDLTVERTVISIDMSGCDEDVSVSVAIHLLDMVEDVRDYYNPFLIGSAQRKRFSFVTSGCNLKCNKTKVVLHLPSETTLLNYLPTTNVTFLPVGSEGQSLSWVFSGTGAEEARVFAEFGSKGKIGALMILIIVAIILALAFMVAKLFLVMYEESLTY